MILPNKNSGQFWWQWHCLVGIVLILVGCSALPTDQRLPQLESQVQPLPEPQTTAAVETHVNADWTNVQSRSEDGLAILGNPDAPVTFIDYSDFL